MLQEVANLESDTFEKTIATFEEARITFDSTVATDVNPEMEAYWADR
jgi:hypothetical protein